MTQGDLDAGEHAARKAVDATGYGGFVTEELLKSIVFQVIQAVDIHRSEIAKKAP